MKHKENAKHESPEERAWRSAKELRKFLISVWNRPYKWPAIFEPRKSAFVHKRRHDNEE